MGTESTNPTANPNTDKITKKLEVGAKSDLKPFEEHAVEKGVPDWQLAGVAADQKWPAGREVTGKQFDKALEDFLSAPLGTPAPAEEAE